MTNPQKPIIKTPLNDPNSMQSRQLNSLITERNSLQNRIRTLQLKQDFWHNWYFGLSVVAGGLAILAAVFKAMAGEFAILTAVFTAFAVAASKMESKRSYDLRPISAALENIEARIEQANRGDSQVAISEASTLASVAEGHTEDLRRANIKLAADLATGVADAQTRAETLRQQNLLLQSELEQEKIERLKLEEKYAHRRLSATQKLDLIKFLKKLPSSFIPVVTYVGTQDGSAYGTDLIEALSAGGWKSTGHPSIVSGGGDLRGVTIWVPDLKHPSQTAIDLQQALKSIGVNAPAITSPQSSPNGAILFIAPKQ